MAAWHALSSQSSAWIDAEVEVGVTKCYQKLLKSNLDSHSQWSTFAYVDKSRGAQRIAALKAAEESINQAPKNDHKKKGKNNKNEAWSDQKARKVEREKRKEKKEKKKAWQKANPVPVKKTDADSATNSKRKQSDDGSDSEDDWDELAREERMAKKVKKGEVDSKAFDQEFSGL